MTTVRVAAVFSMLLAASCGPSTDSLSCNNPPNMSCATVSVSGGTITNKTCSTGVLVDQCSADGIIGRCTLNGLPSGSTCPAGATCTNAFVVYTGGDAAAGQAACTQASGTWSAT